jgi:hypothetical protein
MTEGRATIIVEVLLLGLGLALIWIGAGFMVALGVFFVIEAARPSRR